MSWLSLGVKYLCVENLKRRENLQTEGEERNPKKFRNETETPNGGERTPTTRNPKLPVMILGVILMILEAAPPMTGASSVASPLLLRLSQRHLRRVSPLL